ncbi:hypothetical protein NVP1086O_37 [Vibrio phage 1.086.O._10N.222.51.F8]|nr:hypothetical protein NVP1086O_37 [Vibrio phage 1.086.O._10N.222.51.F8]
MKNADMPAMPQVVTEDSRGNGLVGSHMEEEWQGLTKREMFAMNAMQGILSNSGGVIQGDSHTGTGWCNSNAQDLAKWSLECADALLAELDK